LSSDQTVKVWKLFLKPMILSQMSSTHALCSVAQPGGQRDWRLFTTWSLASLLLTLKRNRGEGKY